MTRVAVPRALKVACASCGHPKYEHGAQQGCTSLVRAMGAIRTCGCRPFVEPAPKPTRTPAQKAIAKALSGHKESHGERTLRQQLQAREIPFRQEAKVIPGRLFRFDFCLDVPRILVEVQGGVWMAGGAHAMPSHLERDAEKAALAAVNGWRLIPCTTEHVDAGQAIVWIEDAVAYRPPEVPQ